MGLNDAQAADELGQDNVRRAQALVEKGMSPTAWNSAVSAMQADTFMQHVLVELGGTDAVDAFSLDVQGRLSHWLDQAEKQVETAHNRERLVIANGRTRA